MNERRTTLSHVDAADRPTMVDVGGKRATRRSARARALVAFPADVAQTLRAQSLSGPKGPIVHTAIVAGVMAAKRTHDLVPFCHPLPLDRVDVHIDWAGDRHLAITCEVAVTHRTGVEMEALTGASVAALTVYDMCKALSHEIVIERTELLAKQGGRRDFDHAEDDDEAGHDTASWHPGGGPT